MKDLCVTTNDKLRPSPCRKIVIREESTDSVAISTPNLFFSTLEPLIHKVHRDALPFYVLTLWHSLLKGDFPTMEAILHIRYLAIEPPLPVTPIDF